MSPILVRPVREQFEHDRVIRVLQARYKRKHEVLINPGSEQNASVSTGELAMYPDLILLGGEKNKKVEGTVEVETVESINMLEAMAEWAPFGRMKAAFYLYVPLASVDSARRLCADLDVHPAEIWSYHPALDQIRFNLVHRRGDVPRLQGKVPKVTISPPKPVEVRAPTPVIDLRSMRPFVPDPPPRPAQTKPTRLGRAAKSQPAGFAAMRARLAEARPNAVAPVSTAKPQTVAAPPPAPPTRAARPAATAVVPTAPTTVAKPKAASPPKTVPPAAVKKPVTPAPAAKVVTKPAGKAPVKVAAKPAKAQIPGKVPTATKAPVKTPPRVAATAAKKATPKPPAGKKPVAKRAAARR